MSNFKIAATLMVVITLFRPSFADQSRDTSLTVLYTNDTHGHLMPFSYPEKVDRKSALRHLQARTNIGGAARRSTLVKVIRNEKGHNTLLIDSGDICDGTPFSTEFNGDADMSVMNAIGYDLACPGNHEFSNSLSQVQKLVSAAKFPYLCANVTVKTTGKLLYTPYRILTIGGARISFFGVMTYDAHTYKAAKDDLVMDMPITVAKTLVPELRAKSDIVIAITHIGIQEDRKLAREVPGIDVIVGGHSHTLLAKPIFTASSTPKIPDSVNGTIIVQDHQWGGTLGRLDLALHRSETGSWTVKSYSGKLLPITASVPEDAAVGAIVAKWWKPIQQKYGEVVGEALDDFTEFGSDKAEYNLVADAVREGMNVDFDMENSGGVRASIVKGPITYGDLVTIDPFGNTVVTFRATGRQLKDILAKHRPLVSGIRYRYSKGELREATINGKPIEDTSLYSGATNSYLASFALKAITNKNDTGLKRLKLVVDYIKKHTPIKPFYDGRRSLKASIKSD